MRVLYISEYFPPVGKGGGEISSFLLAKELVKEGIEIDVLTAWFSGLKRTEKIEGIKILRRLKTGKDPRKLKDNIERLFFKKSLLRELKKIVHNYDVVHCFNTNSIPAVELNNKKTKFIMHVNGPTPFCPKATLMYKDNKACGIRCTRQKFLGCFLNSISLGKRRLNITTKYNPLVIYCIRKRYEGFQYYLKKFDYYMPISNFMKQRLLFESIEINKINVVYNITDFDKFLKLKQPKNKVPKILYLGEYSLTKGPLLLLDALKQIKEPYKANFYGSGELKNELEKRARGLPVMINDSVQYSDVPKIMQQHDIVVFPSLVGEAFGRVALEACAAGKRVIASNIGGVTDIIEDGKTGFLYTPNNTKDLANKIRENLVNKYLLSKTEIRRNVAVIFSKKSIIYKVKTLYSK